MSDATIVYTLTNHKFGVNTDNTVKLILLSWFNEKLFGESGCTLIVWDVYKTYIQRSGHSNILICYLLKNIAI